MCIHITMWLYGLRGENRAQKFYFLHDLRLRDCKSQLMLMQLVHAYCLLSQWLEWDLLLENLLHICQQWPCLEQAHQETFVQIYMAIPAANVFNVSSQRLHNSWTQRKQRGSQPLRTDWQYLSIKMMFLYFYIRQKRRPIWAKHVYHKLYTNLHLNSNGSLVLAWHTDLFSNNLTHTYC